MLFYEADSTRPQFVSPIARILLVTRNHQFRAEISSKLRVAKFDIVIKSSLEEVRTILNIEHIDGCLLDMSTSENAFYICSQLQQLGMAVCLVAHAASPRDIVEGFACGAADVITGSHLETEVLAVRLRKVLACRGISPFRTTESVIKFGPIILYPDRFAALVGDRPIALSLREFRILACLVARPERVATRRDLALACEHHEQDLSDRAIDNFVFRVRKKLGVHGRLIESIRGVGYMLRPSPDPS